MATGLRRRPRTHFTSIGYNPKLPSYLRHLDTKFAASAQFAPRVVPIPCHEAAHPLPDRRVRTKTEVALEIRYVGTGLRDIPGLHRHELPRRITPRRRFDQAQDLADLDRAAGTDVVEPPRSTAAGFIRVLTRPVRTPRRCAVEDAQHGFRGVVDI